MILNERILNELRFENIYLSIIAFKHLSIVTFKHYYEETSPLLHTAYGSDALR